MPDFRKHKKPPSKEELDRIAEQVRQKYQRREDLQRLMLWGGIDFGIGLRIPPHMMQGMDGPREQQISTLQELPNIIRNGEFCAQVVDEVKRVLNMCRQGGRTVAQVKNEFPGMAVWNVLASLGPEDQDTFYHPGTWGPTTGYAKLILGRHFSRSPFTIGDWIKGYNRHKKQPHSK